LGGCDSQRSYPSFGALRCHVAWLSPAASFVPWQARGRVITPTPAAGKAITIETSGARLSVEIRGVLGQVSSVVACLAEVPRPGQRARDGDGEDEGEQVAAPAPLPGIGHPGENLQEPRDLRACGFIGAGHSGIAGMRDLHGGLSWRWDLDSTPVIKPDGRPLRESAPALWPASAVAENRCVGGM